MQEETDTKVNLPSVNYVFNEGVGVIIQANNTDIISTSPIKYTIKIRDLALV